MADWIGNADADTAGRYRLMAERYLDSSPDYRVLCAGVADDAELVARLDALPADKRQPNLLLAAVRYLDGPVTAYPAFRGFVLERWSEVSAVMRVRRTQTNEPRRCATLLPVLAGIDGPVALFEVGASAGLCLLADRYAYRYDGGPQLGSSPVVLDCATAGTVPVPTALPDVVWRGGLDLHPLQVTDADTVRWLECLVWPEHTARFATLRAALQLATLDPPHVRAGDLTRDLVAAVAEAPQDATLVVFHSAVLAYLDGAGRLALRDQVAALAAARPTVWLANEAPGVVFDGELPTGPGAEFVLTRDGVPVALTDQHGASVRWL